MPSWRQVFGLGGQAPERFVAPDPSARFALSLAAALESALSGQGVATRVSRAEALQVGAVVRARNLIAGTLATLPVEMIAPGKRPLDWPLFAQPDPDVAKSVVLAYTFEDLLFEGEAWWRVIERGPGNWPTRAQHVPWGSVHVGGGAGLPSVQRITPDQSDPRDGDVFIDGMLVPDIDVIHFLSPNPPLLVHAARAIRTALVLEQTVEMYTREPQPLGYFKKREGVDSPSDLDIQKIIDDWDEARRRKAWGYAGGLEPVPLSWNPQQMELVGQRREAVLEIARHAGVDPEDFGVSTTSRTYANIEQRRQDKLAFTLGAYVSAFQDRLSMQDVAPPRHHARVNFGGFLRTDTLGRYQAYEIGTRVGAITEDEIRALEDRPPLTPAQKARKDTLAGVAPASMPDRGGSGTGGTPAMGMSNGRHGEVPELAPIKFDAEDGVTRVRFDTPEVSETFRVNVEKRTISGLAVPWGKVARSGFAKWRFAEGSLRWSTEARVKLNLHHDFREVVGHAMRLQSTSRGLDTTFKVGEGPEEDRALRKARDGSWDGFSIEVDFDDEVGDSWQPDPSDESVRLVRQATLRGVALTGMPAFDDARVSAVAATRKGVSMKCSKCGRDHAPEVACTAANPTTQFDLDAYVTKVGESMAASHKQLVEGLTASIGESVSAGIKAALEDITSPQDGPQPVRASRFVVTREAPVYLLNGGGPSLCRDAWNAQMHRDEEAMARVRKFRAQTEDMAKVAHQRLRYAMDTAGAQFTTGTTGNLSEVIPPGYRPDLFVPELAQGRPLVGALSRGTLVNATPFVVPVFASATTAAADHVEGTNPTDGTLAMGTTTVTPGAISGLLKLTREIVDSSNPAIDQIALQAMRESYSQQTEAKVFTALNDDTTGTGGTITSGFVPSGAQGSTVDVTTDDNGAILVRHLRARLAAYPFARFGAPTTGLLNQEATSLLATAVDDVGRPLLPSIGAQNSAGLGNAVAQGWMIDGLPFVPAWSMSGTADADTKALIMARPDAWAWESPVLTFRFEERSGPAVIDLALFGYFATHVLRPVGLSGVRITDDVAP
jgi:HK97 family phage prohead protease/HK97 family phage major capsid protein